MPERHFSVWGPSTDDPTSPCVRVGSFAAVGTVMLSVWSPDHRPGGRMHTDAVQYHSFEAAAAAAEIDARDYLFSARMIANRRFPAVAPDDRGLLFRLEITDTADLPAALWDGRPETA